MNKEKELKLRKVLKEQKNKGSITKKIYKKELKFIKQLKDGESK